MACDGWSRVTRSTNELFCLILLCFENPFKDSFAGWLKINYLGDDECMAELFGQNFRQMDELPS